MLDYILSFSKDRLVLVGACVTIAVIFTGVLVIQHCTKSVESTECAKSEDCTPNKTCLDQKCEDGCKICGAHTSCHVSNHVPYCSCIHGFEGNPMTGCYPGSDTHVAVLECATNNECSQDLACTNQRCQDPCTGVCGVNALCHVKHHQPICACSPGYTGDPFIRCHPNDPEHSQTSGGAKKGKHYKVFVNDKLNWLKAMRKCYSLGMRLVSIENSEQYEDILALLHEHGGDPEHKFFWTSGNDLDEYGTYMWATTDQPMTFTRWADVEPNHKNINGEIEHCVELRGNSGYIMNDQACSVKSSYICESI